VLAALDLVGWEPELLASFKTLRCV
jgi:hypothetical protein